MKYDGLEETVREDDGLRIITKELPYTKRVRIAVVALVGSAYDPPDLEGLHHIGEHMAFKGTPIKSVKELNAIFERYFIERNAYTERLETVYYGEGVCTYFNIIAATLFDIYQNALISPEELDREKEVLCVEIASKGLLDGHLAWRNAVELLWKENPLRRSGLGDPDHVMRITPEHLFGVRQAWHIPKNTLIIGTGHTDHEALVEKAYESFPVRVQDVAHFEWDDELNYLPSERKVIFERPSHKARKKKDEPEKEEEDRATIIFMQKIPKLCDREKNIMFLLMRMLATGDDSLLWNEIREKRGYAYSASGAISVSQQLGAYLLFSTAVKPKRVDEVCSLIPDIVSAYSFSYEAFENMKNGVIDAILVEYETPQDWEDIIIGNIGNDGKPLEYLFDYVSRLQNDLASITFEEICAYREKFIQPEQFICSIVKPVKSKK